MRSSSRHFQRKQPVAWMGLQGPVLYVTLCCCLGCLGFGLTIGYSSPALPQLTKPGQLLHNNPEQASLFGSMAALGGSAGCVAAGLMTEALGRRWTAILTCLPFLLGWTLMVYAQSVNDLLVGRLLTGLASSVAGVLSPMYVAESSPKSWRGVLVTVTCFCITFGVFCGFTLGLFLTWQQQAAVGSILAVLSLFLIPFAPESPRYLVKIGQVTKARRTLNLLQGEGAHVDKELSEIEGSLTEQTMGVLEVIQNPAMRRPLLVAVGLMMGSSLTGIAVIMYFMSSIFKNAGYSEQESLQAPAIIVALQLVSIIVSGAIIDKVGRIPLLIVTSCGMAVSYLIMGLVFYVQPSKEWSWLYFLCLVGYKFSFGLGWGVICPLMATEVTPTKARGPATAISHMSGGIISFVLAALFHSMQASVGSHGVLWLYALFCLAGAAFVIRWVPETKGRTLEEIESFFKSKLHVPSSVLL